MKRDQFFAVGLLLALLSGGLFAPGVRAQSSEPGQTVQELVVRGQGRVEASPAPSNILPEQAATEYFATRPDAEYKIPRTARTNLAVPETRPLAAQAVTGNRVIDPAQAPVPFTGFTGLSHLDQRTAGTGDFANSQFSLEPPDQALCVGNGFIVEAVNTALAIYDTSGNRLSGPTPLNQFFELAPAVVRGTQPVYGDFTSDPKCLYDPTTGRFFFTLLQIDVDPQTGDFLPSSHTEIAVSQTSDPTGDWNFFRIVTTDDGRNGTPFHTGCELGCLGDQPLIGVDAYGFYVTTNEFSLDGTTFNGAQVYAMSKKALISARKAKVVHVDNLSLAEGPAYSLQPATSPDASQYDLSSGGTQYFLSALDFDATLDNRIAVWALTNTSSLDGKRPRVRLTSQLIDTQVYGQPPPANQKAGPTPLADSVEETLAGLETNDDRMNQVVFANGKLYSAVTSIVVVEGKRKPGSHISWSPRRSPARASRVCWPTRARYPSRITMSSFHPSR